jgi:hypothetical protein
MSAASRHRAPVLHAVRPAGDPAADRQSLLHRLDGNATHAARIQALDDAGYLAVLRPRFGDFLGGSNWPATATPIR